MPALLACPTTRSAFVESYRAGLSAWAKDLESRQGLIVAIARKAPRLLELLVDEGLLSPTVLRRVVSERALPFLSEPSGPLTVVDDAIRWGSTFQRIVTIAQDAVAPWQAAESVEGLPFAVSEGAEPRFLQCVSKYFLKLRLPEVSPFAQSQVTAYRLGGSPLDIDHPTATFRGDFSDLASLEELLHEVVQELSGQLIPLTSCVPASDSPTRVFAWSLLLPAPNHDGLTSDVCKLRLFLNAAQDRLTLAAMHPITISRATLERATELLPECAAPAWTRLTQAVRPSANGCLRVAADCSLATMFNWLHAVPLLANSLKRLEHAFERWDWRVTTTGPRADDLRLLVGLPLARELEPLLAEHLNGAVPPSNAQVALTTGVVPPDTWIPTDYATDYASQLETLQRHVVTTEDALQAVLLAQHFAIELPSRTAENNSHDRLEFGVAFRYLVQQAQRAVPGASEPEIHAAFDRLIDEGCIVPRYIKVAVGDDFVWMRAYRVGEGPLEQLLHTVRLLAETLSKELNSDTIPRLLLEKYAVLALSDDLRQRRLAPLASLPTRKDFFLYGARQSVVLGRDKRFLLDWATDRKLFDSSAKDDDEVRRAYRLNSGLDAFLPPEDIAWDKDARRAIRDLAKLVVKIHATKGLGSDALVLITSVATGEEHLRAAETELDLWLHDRRASIYGAVAEMALLADDQHRGVAKAADLAPRLADLADLLVRTANFTAQEASKTKLAGRRAAIFKEIDAAVKGDQTLEDVWEDLSDILASREVRERRASGLPTILSALRIAYAANRLLRDLLAHAGWKDQEGRSLPLPASLELLEERLGGLRGTAGTSQSRVDEYALRFLASWNGRPSVKDLIAQARETSAAPFPEAFSACRRLILEIADRCDAILRAYGSDQYRESPVVLEPPLYLVMWDIEGSTERDTRQPMEELITKAQERIAQTLGADVIDFRPQSRDDGNGLICRTFADALLAFGTLADVYAEAAGTGQQAIRFRCGVEANVQGRLHYYPKTRVIDAAYGGRAYEHAARIAGFFKEIGTEPSRWSGTALPAKPLTSYLVVGEFARRYAEQEGSWPPATWKSIELPGRYSPRVHGALPIQVFVVTERNPVAS